MEQSEHKSDQGRETSPQNIKIMERPQIWHTPSEEEIKSGYIVSDSEVMDAIKILKMYARQTMDKKTKLYFDAKAKGQEDFAGKHLKRYTNARYIEMECETITKFYNDSK